MKQPILIYTPTVAPFSDFVDIAELLGDSVEYYIDFRGDVNPDWATSYAKRIAEMFDATEIVA